MSMQTKQIEQMYEVLRSLSAVVTEAHGGVTEATQELEHHMSLLDEMMKPVEITSDMVKELRSLTGEGMMSCHKALKHCSGDMQKAVDYLRRSGTLCI